MVEGTASVAIVAHVASCPSCQSEVAVLERVLASAVSVDVPEPSPLFWDHLSSRVREAVAAEPQPVPDGWTARWWPWRVGALAGVAVMMIAVGVSLREPPAMSVSAVSSRSSADDGVGPAEAAGDDASLALLADLASDLDWEGVAEVGWTIPAGTMDRVLVDLSAAERIELRRLLTEELAVSNQSL